MADTIQDFSTFRSLVIDDFGAMRTMLADMLKSYGARSIDMAANGREAVSQLSTRQYDIVLCDFNLGPGKNGQQLLEEAKFRNWISPTCAWMMITAEQTPDSVHGAVEYQPDGYLIKPVNAGLLHQRLGRVLARKSVFADIDVKLRRKDVRGALAKCDEKIKQEKQYASELLRWKAQMLVSIGDFEPARALLEEVLKGRDLAWARVALAEVMQYEGDYHGSCQLLKQVIDELPAHVRAYDLLAVAQEKLGQFEQARKTLESAARLSPNSPVRQKNMGELALRCGDTETAEASFRKSMTVGQHSVLKTPDSYIGLAHIIGGRHQTEEAARLLGTLPQVFEDAAVHIRAKAVEGLIYQQNGMAEQAEQSAVAVSEMMKKAALHHDTKASMETAALFFQTGRKEAAVALLSDVVRNNPDDQALLARVSKTYSDAGLHEEGMKWVKAARDEATALMNEGVLLARDRKLPEAVASMRRAVAAMPANVRVLVNCGHVMMLSLEQRDDPQLRREAVEVLMTALSLAPGDKRCAKLLAQLGALN